MSVWALGLASVMVKALRSSMPLESAKPSVSAGVMALQRWL